MISKIFAFIALFALAASPRAKAQSADFHVIPLPKEVKSTQAGSFRLDETTLVCYPAGDKELKRAAEWLAGYVREITGLKLIVTSQPAQRHCIRLSSAMRHENPEAYNIRVNSEIILIDGATAAGTFYGVQTFRKALPVGTAQAVSIPATEVRDWPRFAYRGTHLDVSRHFITADSVKRFIDILALHHINRFHWHLTDDQGWRIEIKKYPLLTKVGAWRDQTVIGHNSGKYDGKPHGGFYTQKEIKDVVRYAAERHITIIPEIDMPGHMQAALAAYPELGCTGGPYKVWQMWGVTDSVLCAGNEKTYEFIDNVLDEVVKLFPSEYIHVGGDECPKTEWAKCARCQAFIQANSLQADGQHTAEERLQSHLIHHAEAHLNRLGRQMIGWDETLEGGLAPNATVMSWRGEAGGIEAARQNHDVIMTPNTYCYFDYCQADDYTKEPCGASSYLPIERVYSYEPMPESLTPEQQKHIIGVQANCWTEYMRNFRDVEYMIMPRYAALSEVQWCDPAQKDWDDFAARLGRYTDLYRKLDYNFARTIYGVTVKLTPDTQKRAVIATLSTIDDAPLHYSLDGSDPAQSPLVYTAPIELRTDCELRAAAVRQRGEVTAASATVSFNKATACPVTLLQKPNTAYTYGGAPMLTDGIRGTDTNFSSGKWIGFSQNDLEAVIDLGTPTSVSSVSVNTCVGKGSWVFDARGLEVQGSADGQTFSPIASESYPEMKESDPDKVYTHTLTFSPVSARYLKVKVVSERCMPAWHGAAGKAGFVFVDEIAVH